MRSSRASASLFSAHTARRHALLFAGASGNDIAARPGYPSIIVPFGTVPNAPTPAPRRRSAPGRPARDHLQKHFVQRAAADGARLRVRAGDSRVPPSLRPDVDDREGTVIDDERQTIATSEAMVRRRFAELDKQNFAILDELFDPGYVLNFPGLAKPLDLAATKQFYRRLYAAFPDLRHDIAEQVSARDKVVTRWTARGTHRGEWMGVPATGKPVTLTGINIYTVKRGKLAESHVTWDIWGLMQQIGASPAAV
jgi:steroid delta-isomerase-like uncharacterized protein